MLYKMIAAAYEWRRVVLMGMAGELLMVLSMAYMYSLSGYDGWWFVWQGCQWAIAGDALALGYATTMVALVDHNKWK